MFTPEQCLRLLLCHKPFSSTPSQHNSCSPNADDLVSTIKRTRHKFVLRRSVHKHAHKMYTVERGQRSRLDVDRQREAASSELTFDTLWRTLRRVHGCDGLSRNRPLRKDEHESLSHLPGTPEYPSSRGVSCGSRMPNLRGCTPARHCPRAGAENAEKKGFTLRGRMASWIANCGEQIPATPKLLRISRLLEET